MDAAARDLLESARRGVLVTVDAAGRPRPTPFCFVVSWRDGALVLHTPIDEKPKGRTDPLDVPRIRDIRGTPEVTVLVDRWDEDWSRLAWLILRGTATLISADDRTAAIERAAAIDALRVRYPQYARHALEDRPIVRIDVTETVSWDAATAGGSAPRRTDEGSGSTPSPGYSRPR